MASRVGILDQFGRPLMPDVPARSNPFSRRSSYDAADTNTGNSRHWANADGLSAKAANSPEVRRKLRERARLEFDNGGNCKGAIETIGHDLIGTGPRLQLTLPEGTQEDAAKIIERKFRDWCDDPAVNFADKLRVMVESELRDGESFAIFMNDEKIEGQVKFNFRIIEAEQIATPSLMQADSNAVDGIVFDKNGNPESYHLLREHPGDSMLMNPGYDSLRAATVVHWFRPSRAGAARGIPRITPGLSLIAMKRGYASAALASARLGATYTGAIETNLPPDGGPVSVAEYDPVPAEDGTYLTMPAGWKLNQIKPEHPTASYKEFSESHLTEFGRAIHCPKNVITGDSAGMNFSSSRLDHLMYRGFIRIERNRISVIAIDRIFKAWAREAISTVGYLEGIDSVQLPPIVDWQWCWQFDGFPSINPTDDANADDVNLKNGLVTHGELLAQRGVAWREHFDALAEQRAYAKQLGIEDLVYPWLAENAAAMATTRKPTTQAERDTVLEEEAAYA